MCSIFSEQNPMFHFHNALETEVHLKNRNLKQGINKVSFDASDFISGVYFLVLQTHIGRNVPTKFVKQ